MALPYPTQLQPIQAQMRADRRAEGRMQLRQQKIVRLQVPITYPSTPNPDFNACVVWSEVFWPVENAMWRNSTVYGCVPWVSG